MLPADFEHVFTCIKVHSRRSICSFFVFFYIFNVKKIKNNISYHKNCSFVDIFKNIVIYMYGGKPIRALHFFIKYVFRF